MEFASPIITAVVDSLMVPLKKHLGFFFSSTKHVAKMNKKLSELNEAKHDMEEKKNDALVKDRPVPRSLPDWLEEVETITKEKENIPTGGNGCFNLKNRYKAGKGSFNLIKEIDDLLEKQKNIKWSEEQIPLGRVRSCTEPSTSERVHDDDDTQNMFTSRKSTFECALKSLQQDSNTQKIALCGMGGVGKTTMMEELEKVVRKKGMFKWVLKAGVGQKTNLNAIQQAISQYMPEGLNETTSDARAARLEKIFMGMSENGKNNILVILDDVWEEINLKDIALTSPLPNGFKLLVTSRDEKVCIKMDIDTSSIFKVVGLDKTESNVLLWEIVKGLPGGDGELRLIGEEILNKCGGLPLAIKTIALTLRDGEKDAWKDALVRLQRHDHEDLYAIMEGIFDISYNKLRKDDKSIFILCGLFPDDFDIPREELMRYGWGLQLFKKTYSLIEARHRTNTSISKLIHANLLNESDAIGYVRMHDLARDFILSNIARFKQASIVSHADKSEWPTKDTNESCERILVNCAGMSEFPQDFYYPNLALLKLMDGDKQLKFPEDFHKRMEKLEVMAYDKMENPLRGVSLCDSVSLRTLCFHSGSLVDNDISFLGNLVNLEVLSIAHCGIRKLPSTIGKLKKLKLLDLTGCVDLCIDDGVFQNLDKLEELYLRVSDDMKGIRFTDANEEMLQMLLPKLYALEVDFFQNILQWKDVSFEKLQRFRISFGCFLEVNTRDNYSLKNTLRLVTKYSDLLECKITKLFSKTEELFLSVKDTSCVEDISMSPSQGSTLCNLKVLHVFECPDLTHLFTIPMANGLKQLESLKVSSCPVLKSLVISSSDGVNIMELPQLVKLELCHLPNFTSIILKNDISATQPLLSKEVLVPKLSKLRVDGLTKLKEIWACDITSGEEDNNVSMLREIEVNNCKSVVNLFPRNPIRLLRHLEELSVVRCGSIQVLFNIDVNTEQLSSSNTSSLRRIYVEELDELREVWKINDENNSGHLIRGFQAVEYIYIRRCKKFRNVFTPTTAKLDMGALVDMSIGDSGESNVELVNSSQEEEFSQVGVVSWSLCQYSRKIYIYKCPALSSLVPSYSARQMQKLEELEIKGCSSMVEVFETKDINNNNISDCSSSDVDQGSDVGLLTPRAKNITMHKLTNLKSLKICDCDLLKYTFTFSTCESLTKLENLIIRCCGTMEVIVREENGETSFKKVVVEFPRLKSIELENLPKLEGFLLGMNIDIQFPSLEYVKISDCPQMKVFTSGKSTTPKLKYIHTWAGKHNLECGLNFHHEISASGAPWSFHNLLEINLERNEKVKKIVQSNELVHLQNLEKIHVKMCDGLEEVFEEVTNNESQTVVKFSKLREVKLEELMNLKYTWKSNQWSILEFPNLTRLVIKDCKSLEFVFTASMVGSLKQLQELDISLCDHIDIIVKKEEECDANVGEIMFPCLKSLKLEDLSSLEGFCLGRDDFFIFINGYLGNKRMPRNKDFQ